MAVAVALAQLVIVGALASGCSYPSNDTPYPGTCVPLHPVATVPLANGVGVPTDVTFRITFDGYPDPDTVRSNTLLLTTGYFWVPGSYGVDLIGKAAVMRPISRLAPQLGYSLHLRPALASLDGCPGTSQEIEFQTGDGPAGEAPAPPAPFADVRGIFSARCASGCHLGDDGFCLSSPAGGLSLCAAEAWDRLVAVPSRERDDLRLVEAGNSARSYLLRKLLPATGSAGPITGVYGQREPPGEPLSEDQLRAVASWIDSGALR